jgi:hypothetical protein
MYGERKEGRRGGTKDVAYYHLDGRKDAAVKEYNLWFCREARKNRRTGAIPGSSLGNFC